MQQPGLFSPGKTVYWPSEFLDLVCMLKGQDSTGAPSHPAMYSFNTGAIVLAAVLGLIHGRERDVGPQRQEINVDIFERQKLGNSPLASFILLVPLIGTNDLDLLRPEREDELIGKFQRYSAGGLEYLRGAMSRSSDSTGHALIKSELELAMAAIPALIIAGEGLPKEEDLQI
jgi:hypothetical protein